jgi:ABC-type branched-subunit amino acid transport system ATPase component
VGEVYEVIAGLRDDGLTVVLVEQAVGWAASVADRIAVLETGHKIYEGDPIGTEAEAAVARIELGGEFRLGAAG